ncbi:hypothetical protein AB0B25_29995 [Nocardia sp. NPDC049190]|uniref:hypothetical protein n=1 Tax=Nocardia sp. NPDC049190 TaxID=3155650 RepID=UPI0033C2F435
MIARLIRMMRVKWEAEVRWLNEPQTIHRINHVGIVVEEFAVAIAFFVELGLELEGEATVSG